MMIVELFIPMKSGIFKILKVKVMTKLKTIAKANYLVVNKFICFFIGHIYKVVGRSNGDMWGWNNLECKRCKCKSDTLTD